MAGETGIFVGIDVSKAWLDVAVHEKALGFRTRNNEAGIMELVGKLKELRPVLVAMESTGGPELVIVASLAKTGLTVIVSHPRRIRAFARLAGQPASRDKCGAELLAQFACASATAAFFRQRQIPMDSGRLLPHGMLGDGRKERSSQ